jgi:hypothetical protein
MAIFAAVTVICVLGLVAPSDRCAALVASQEEVGGRATRPRYRTHKRSHGLWKTLWNGAGSLTLKQAYLAEWARSKRFRNPQTSDSKIVTGHSPC